MKEWGRAWSGDPEDDPEVAHVAGRLVHGRPAPGAGLRGQVRAFLAAVEAGGLLVARPPRLWLRVAVCGGVGAALLALVAAGVAGWGPFAG